MTRMNENWAICHDNGVAGQRGASDGFTSEAQAVKFATGTEVPQEAGEDVRRDG